MQIYPNISLADKNTLRLAASAEWYCEVSSIDELMEAAEFAISHRLDVIPLGEGSNVVLVGDLEGLVIRNRMLGVTTTNDCVTVPGGENWHDLVVSTVESGLYGLENLALIPGSAGAAPVQNIGAYGVDLSDRFMSLSAVHLPTLETRVFERSDCAFGYRDSLFKKDTSWFITDVSLELSGTSDCVLNYPGIEAYLDDHALEVSGVSILRAVSHLRRQKLPDPHSIPNVGSFFKNPVVSPQTANLLSKDHPGVPQFDVPEGKKLSAAWLIDRLGLKGYREGDMGVSEKHALVIVNMGNGQRSDLLVLIDKIRREVRDAYGIALEIEPRIYPEDADLFNTAY